MQSTCEASSTTALKHVNNAAQPKPMRHELHVVRCKMQRGTKAREFMSEQLQRDYSSSHCRKGRPRSLYFLLLLANTTAVPARAHTHTNTYSPLAALLPLLPPPADHSHSPVWSNEIAASPFLACEFAFFRCAALTLLPAPVALAPPPAGGDTADS